MYMKFWRPDHWDLRKKSIWYEWSNLNNKKKCLSVVSTCFLRKCDWLHHHHLTLPGFLEYFIAERNDTSLILIQVLSRPKSTYQNLYKTHDQFRCRLLVRTTVLQNSISLFNNHELKSSIAVKLYSAATSVAFGDFILIVSGLLTYVQKNCHNWQSRFSLWWLDDYSWFSQTSPICQHKPGIV